jgi:hypothetical protein
LCDACNCQQENFVQQQNLIAELEAKLSVYGHLAEAAEDMRFGRVQNADDVFDELTRELDRLEL